MSRIVGRQLDGCIANCQIDPKRSAGILQVIPHDRLIHRIGELSREDHCEEATNDSLTGFTKISAKFRHGFGHGCQNPGAVRGSHRNYQLFCHEQGSKTKSGFWREQGLIDSAGCFSLNVWFYGPLDNSTTW
jgi:hypothetical protein